MNVNIRTAGLSLIEIVVASTLLAAVMLMTNMVMRASLYSVEATSSQADSESKAAAVMDMMAKELKDSGTKDPNFKLGNLQQSITFARCTGYLKNTDPRISSVGKPTFGNTITYAFKTYGETICLERTEIIAGVERKQILTDQLSNTKTTVKTAQGVDIDVIGINFQHISNVVTITLVLRNNNYLSKQNKSDDDDNLVVTSQSSVKLTNN